MSQQVIRLIVTSDTHGHWLNQPDNPKASLFNTATCIENLKAKEADVTLTIDLGDFIQGSSFATYLSQERQDGRVIARAMNVIGYDYQLIGNHEFNFGQDYRDQIIEDLNADLLVSNIIDDATGKPFLGKPYDIIERDGIKIGIVGVTTSYIPNWELPAHYEGLRFEDAFESAKYYVEIVRDQVDVVILAYHGGFERDLVTKEPLEELTKENQGSEMLAGIEGVDVLLTGHQHRELNQQVGQTYVIQPGYAGEIVAEVEIELTDNQEVSGINGTLHNTSQCEVNQAVKAVMEPEITDGNNWLNTVLGVAPLEQVTTSPIDARLNGHPFIELLNQIQFDETGADFSSVALVNDAFVNFHGEITNEILLKSYPFYNLIAKVNVTGNDLYEVMEFNLQYLEVNAQGNIQVNPEYVEPKPRHYNFDVYSGMTTTVDMTQPVGHRVTSIVDNRTGEKLDKNATYSVALSQYRAVGGGDFKWYGKEKIESISNIDIATLMKDALSTYSQEKWDYINSNYQHLKWEPKLNVADMNNP
ncbi:MAG: bifunctional metallophosphatase/5'-nucleotidase [Ruoffia tabacinasalis]